MPAPYSSEFRRKRQRGDEYNFVQLYTRYVFVTYPNKAKDNLISEASNYRGVWKPSNAILKF